MTNFCFKIEHEEPNAEDLSNKWLINNAIALYTPQFYFIFNILFNYKKCLFHTTWIGVIKKVGFCGTNYAFVVTMTSTTSFCLRGP